MHGHGYVFEKCFNFDQSFIVGHFTRLRLVNLRSKVSRKVCIYVFLCVVIYVVAVIFMYVGKVKFVGLLQSSQAMLPTISMGA